MSLVPEATDYEAWIAQLSIPHRAKQAYRHLLGDPKALPAIQQGARHHDPVIRNACCRLLDHLADEASFPLLITVLDDPDAGTRGSALHALACDRCKADVPTPPKERLLGRAIDMLLHDPSEGVRAMAAEVVAKWVHEDPSAAEALREASRSDPHPAVRKKAGWYAPGGTIYRRTEPHEARTARVL